MGWDRETWYGQTEGGQLIPSNEPPSEISNDFMVRDKGEFYNSQQGISYKYSDAVIGYNPPSIVIKDMDYSPMIVEPRNYISFCISGWFQIKFGELTHDRVLLARWDADPGNGAFKKKRWKLLTNDEGKIEFIWTNDGEGLGTHPVTQFALKPIQPVFEYQEKWHHVLVMVTSTYAGHNSTTVAMYSDGKLLEKSSTNDALVFLGNPPGRDEPPISIGCELDNSSHGNGVVGGTIFNGSIDDVAFWMGSAILREQDEALAVRTIYGLQTDGSGRPIDLNYAKKHYIMNRDLAHWWTFEPNSWNGGVTAGNPVHDMANSSAGTLKNRLSVDIGTDGGSMSRAIVGSWMEHYTYENWERPPREDSEVWDLGIKKLGDMSRSSTHLSGLWARGTDGGIGHTNWRLGTKRRDLFYRSADNKTSKWKWSDDE